MVTCNGEACKFIERNQLVSDNARGRNLSAERSAEICGEQFLEIWADLGIRSTLSRLNAIR